MGIFERKGEDQGRSEPEEDFELEDLGLPEEVEPEESEIHRIEGDRDQIREVDLNDDYDDEEEPDEVIQDFRRRHKQERKPAVFGTGMKVLFGSAGAATVLVLLILAWLSRRSRRLS